MPAHKHRINIAGRGVDEDALEREYNATVRFAACSGLGRTRRTVAEQDHM
jgi:hypothetical protein